MIRIALCDNDPDDLNELLILLEQYRSQRGWDLIVMPFHSSLDLLTTMERGIRFDILLMDILMPGQNGIETTAEIRNFDSDVKIIFLTSSSEFAVQSYTVNACDYQLKPIQAERFFKVLDSVFDSCTQERASQFLI
ncbi:MAG: LytTR family DNA-binding domain-containing protein, partial [Lachnospiraceae bacterium]|nr:LytTR family DNA-binding domain-containing protein [Lachnospiraceae bacterium]